MGGEQIVFCDCASVEEKTVDAVSKINPIGRTSSRPNFIAGQPGALRSSRSTNEIKKFPNNCFLLASGRNEIKLQRLSRRNRCIVAGSDTGERIENSAHSAARRRFRIKSLARKPILFPYDQHRLDAAGLLNGRTERALQACRRPAPVFRLVRQDNVHSGEIVSIRLTREDYAARNFVAGVFLQPQANFDFVKKSIRKSLKGSLNGRVLSAWGAVNE